MLRDRRILITGGARGLGRAFAEAAIAAGARVAVADVLEEAGRATASDIGAVFAPLDLASGASINACVNAAAAALDGLDGLVNNGAITTSGGKTLEELDLETWDHVMAVNVRGTWLATRAALPYLRSSRNGRVVNIASDTALWGAPRLLAYVASKGAVIAMTRSMARELGTDGVTVNAVAPGLTVVEATEYVPVDRHALYAGGRALNRAQVPDDVCGTVIYLLSDAAAFVTGQLLAVNGGFVMH
ncbi:MAG TPA: SDR family oxidoreductase [Xanthobacteraceae bacterium]|jgi:NAD(P)-dependent dehydrogenase (short-subunit alcohol dehydrogenase family)